MASPYTSVSIANYNANAPADDGSEVASNQITWAKHKTKLADPIKTLAESINTNIIAAFGDRLLNAETQKTGAYTVTTGDRGALVNCTSGTFTVTLPAAATAGDGFEVIIYNSGSGVITVDGNASETVNSSATQTLTQGFWLMLRCDGSNWNGIGGMTNVTSTAAELNLLDGVTATTAEINELDASAAAVSNYVSGIRTYVRDLPSSAFNVNSSITEATWETVGPTSSGATNVWASLDDAPTGTTGYIIRCTNSVTGASSGNLYAARILAIKNGETESDTISYTVSRNEWRNTTGSSDNRVMVSEFYVPCDSNGLIDVYWNDDATNPTVALNFYLVGFIV